MSEQQQLFSPFPPAMDMFDMDYAKRRRRQPEDLNFFTFHDHLEVEIPTLDSFEADVDFSVAALSDDVALQLFTVDAAFSNFQSDASACGPPSTITASSESCDDTTDSMYSSPHSFFTDTSSYTSSHFDDLNFQGLAIPDFGTPQMGTIDPDSFGLLPPTPIRSLPPILPIQAVSITRNNVPIPSDYRFAFGDQPPSLVQATTISPSHMSGHFPPVPTTTNIQQVPASKAKHRCTMCPKAFDRRFNLKTHMDTHNPHRVKPHICPHESCARSFSRKHDLGRHLFAIHKEGPDVAAIKKKNGAGPLMGGIDIGVGIGGVAGVGIGIGITRAPRERCDRCGKSWAGPSPSCDCAEVEPSHVG